MARARNIKPGFFSNDELAECSPLSRLLFIGLWLIADREGRLEDRPKRIKGLLFPFDNCEISEMLDELSQRDFIVRYQANGRKYLAIPNFLAHQRPHANEAESVIPAPLATKVESPCGQGDKHFALNDESLLSESLNDESLLSERQRVKAEAARFVAAWNATPGVIKISRMSEGRKTKLEGRIADKPWDWEAALKKFPLRCFIGHPDGWKPDFDFITRPDTVTKILEGKYDWDRDRNQTAGKASLQFTGIPEDIE